MRNVSDTAAVADVPPRRFAPWSDRDLERYVVGELPADIAARLEADAAQQPALAAHLADRRAEQNAFALAHPWRAPLPAPVSAPWWRGWLLPSRALPALLAAASLVVVVRAAGPGSVAARGGGAFAGAHVTLTVKRGDRVFAWQEGVRVRAHDSLQLVVDLPQPAGLSVALRPIRTPSPSAGRDSEGPESPDAVGARASAAGAAPSSAGPSSAGPSSVDSAADFVIEGLQLPAGRSTLPNSLVLDDEVQDEELTVYASVPQEARVIGRFTLVKEPAPLAPAPQRRTTEGPG